MKQKKKINTNINEHLNNGLTAVHNRLAELEILQNELKQVKKKLQDSEEKYRIILESIEEAYFELDLAGNITFFNKAAMMIVGYTEDEMIGMNSRKYVSPSEQRRLYNMFNKIYKTGNPEGICDYEIIKKDGSSGFREISASLKVDSSGHPIGFKCVARDVTKRKLVEEKLKESNTALKVFLKYREENQMEIEKNVLSNVKEIILPYITELKKSRLTTIQMAHIDIIEANLMKITSPFLRMLTLKEFNLTPKEIQVANLVKEGRTTKEIADVLYTSTGAISFHRNNIRKKFGFNSRKMSLRSYLLSMA